MVIPSITPLSAYFASFLKYIVYLRYLLYECLAEFKNIFENIVIFRYYYSIG
jgi:hypothetical protein